MSRRYIEGASLRQLPSISANLLEHHSTSYGPHLKYLLRLNVPQCARSSAQSPPISLDLLGAGVNLDGGSGWASHVKGKGFSISNLGKCAVTCGDSCQLPPASPKIFINDGVGGFIKRIKKGGL